MKETRPAVLVVGDESLPEMRPISALMRGRSDLEVRRAQGIDDLERYIRCDAWHPDLIIVLHPWPDQFSGREVNRLLTLAPLSRIACICGAWCDSEGRTHNQWPLAVRASLACAPRRIADELSTIRGETEPRPFTAGRSEIFSTDFALVAESAEHSMPVAVISPDRHWRRMISDGLRRAGHRTVDPVPQDSPVVIVCDADPWNAMRGSELQGLRREFPNARLVAALGFDRSDVAIEICAAGAHAVWSKLAPLDDLWSLLADKCSQPV